MDRGLTAWSIDGCATQAHCAKGLVLHYFKSKGALLTAMAQALRGARWAEWERALKVDGVGALDALWGALVAEASGGTARAILDLRLAGVAETAFTPQMQNDLHRRLAQALETPPAELPSPATLEPLFEGYLLALIGGTPEPEARDAFFRWWLSYVR